MPITLFESGAKKEKKLPKVSTSILSGFVTNNLDCIKQGKVLVRIPSLDQEVWARIVGTGASGGRGSFKSPQINDEVLVALNDNDPDDSFIIGGLWTSSNPPPIDNPLEAETKYVIKTGLTEIGGHEIVLDDVNQTITIQTKIAKNPLQKLVMDVKGGIEISTFGSTLTINLDLSSKPPTIKLSALGNIELMARGGDVSILGKKVDIEALTECNIRAPFVKLNCP